MSTGELSKLQRMPWTTLAVGAYLVNNFEAAELVAPHGVPKTQHLLNLLAAEFGADVERSREMSRELALSIGSGGAAVVDWSRDDIRTWVYGQFVFGVNYEVLVELLEIENESIQESGRADSASG
jgi:hypothetical protein